MEVFELVDVTDDEKYYSLGIWLTLEEATSALDACQCPDDLGSYYCHDDYCMVQIRERKVGWCSPDGKPVCVREWAATYDEAKDEFSWHVLPSTATPKTP